MKTIAEVNIYIVDEKTGKKELIAYNMTVESVEALAEFAKKNMLKPTENSKFDNSNFAWS